jgi:hypothetical protein
MNDANSAILDFQKIRNHRGAYIGGIGITQNASTTLMYPLAGLGLARAYAAMPDKNLARAAYKQFLAEWSSADSDLQPVVSARSELEQLGK